MRTIAVAALALVVLAGGAAAEPLLGLWRTAPDDNGNSGLVEIAPCGSLLCGTLVRAFGPGGEEVASPDIGRLIITGTTARGGGDYRGKIWSPDRDKTYSSRLTLAGDELGVQGCVLGICRDGGRWRRAD